MTPFHEHSQSPVPLQPATPIRCGQISIEVSSFVFYTAKVCDTFEERLDGKNLWSSVGNPYLLLAYGAEKRTAIRKVVKSDLL